MARPADPRYRVAVRIGIRVAIIQKPDQRSGRKTEGVVDEILTSSAFHPHGIKVRLKDGRVGRVTTILQESGEST